MGKHAQRLGEARVYYDGARSWKILAEIRFTNINQVQENYVSMLTKLKNLLDDKGVICKEDIEPNDYSFLDDQLNISNDLELKSRNHPKIQKAIQ